MLNWYEQENPTSCVAACVRMVLSGFQVNRTEAQIRELLGRPRLGITLIAAATRLQEVGIHAMLYDDLERG